MKNFIKWMAVATVTGIAIGGFPVNLSADDAPVNNSGLIEEVKKNGPIGIIPDQKFDIKDTTAFQNQIEIHSDFRKNFRYHFQTVGVANFLDNSYVFIVAEPSPQVSEDDIKNIFSKFNCDFQTKQHKIGYDGFVRDMLVVVGNATKENIAHLNAALHEKLYFSSYKSDRSTMNLPIKERRRYFAETNLNYAVSLAELYKWFFEKNELFLDENDNVFSIGEALVNNKYGNFFSKDSGFVAWIIDKRKDLNRQKQNIRQFTLDADLILGAFSNDDKLVVIGRERESISSMFTLPPLNVETILLLASIKSVSLSQSLDMDDLLAGKMTNEKDWCPTYLSKELENTEFGNLLTLTDVLLKDWSEFGNLEYEEFDYPKPKSYPFDEPLFQKLGIKSLVYNWNTGRGDSVSMVNKIQMNDYCIYSIMGTGALLVSYFDDSRQDEIPVEGDYESQAYNYFANINNTDLVRVVQYQTLYTLFKNNGVTYEGPGFDNNPPEKPYLLKNKTWLLLANIKNLSDKDKATVARNIAVDSYGVSQIKESENEINSEIERKIAETKAHVDAEVKKAAKENEQHLAGEIKKSGLDESDEQIVQFIRDARAAHEKSITDFIMQNEAELKRVVSEFKQDAAQQITGQIDERQNILLSDVNIVQAILKELDDNAFTQLCLYLSYPRGDIHMEPDVAETAKKIIKHMKEIRTKYYRHLGVDISDVMAFYSDSLKDNSSKWIKTPSLVLTYDNPGVVGGHNLSTAIRVMNSLLSSSLPRNRSEVITPGTNKTKRQRGLRQGVPVPAPVPVPPFKNRALQFITKEMIYCISTS